MDEIIVRLARTLACQTRLKLLACLVAEGEKSPTELARRLRLSLATVSVHIGKLWTAGIIQRRHSGTWSYCVASSPYAPSTLSGKTLSWIRELLAPHSDRKDCGSGKARNRFPAGDLGRVQEQIFDAATAFTDLRRLRILRYLLRVESASGATLRRELKMSHFAQLRHCDKLLRRGYLCHRTAPEPSYRLAESFKTPIHATLWQIVRANWPEKLLRT